MKVGYQGVPGSYSETALQAYCQSFEDVETLGYSNFKDVILDLAAKKLDMIVIPVENSTTGFIARSADLLRHQPVVSVADRYESINHTLWGLKGSKVSDIKEVYSHPEALSQCHTFFVAHPHLTAKAYEDTAKAAAFIAETKNPHQAALASPRAGELYGLEPLQRDVQTEASNTTRFYILKHQDNVEAAGSQMALYVETRHEAGALSKLLQVFDLFDCNVLALNARPIPGEPFAYGFFIEIDLKNLSISFDTLWQTLNQVSEYVQLLGQFDPATRKRG